ncbi:MAG: radical SAM protein [Candidatus Sigynarchaeota archaeon]
METEVTMKVVLVYPNYLESFYVIPTSSHLPIGLAMIAAVLRDAGHDVTVIDATVQKLNIHRLTRRVAQNQPDIIGITANVAFGWKALLTGKWLKRALPASKVIFGGPWPSTEYQALLDRGAADIVVIGEGERTIVALLDALKAGTPLENIKGIAFKGSAGIVATDRPPLIDDLDALPFPAWDLFPSPSKYVISSKGKRHYPIMTSRGCPFDCINCTKFIHGYKLRTRSIENVIAEIKYLRQQFHADEIVFIDDGFNFNVERTELLCDAIIALDFKIHIRCPSIRADRLTPRLAWKLKEAGAYDVAVGIESGNQAIVNNIGKNLDLHAAKRAIRLLKRLRILTMGFFMVGLPGENIHTVLDTKRFIMESGLDIVDIFKIVPIPGTKLADIIAKNAIILEDPQKRMQFYSYDKPVFEMPGMPRELVMLAIKDMYRSFYMNARKLSWFVKQVAVTNWRWYMSAFLLVLRHVFRKDPERGTRDVKAVILEKIRKGKSDM